MQKALHFIPIVLVGLFTLQGCHMKKSDQAPADNITAIADTTSAEQVADSTLYGTSTEDFGMSTFSMVTDQGDTLHLCRTSEDGTDGKIYGSLEYGQRYALTTRDNGEAVGVLINLTELDKKLKNYEIRNGKLIVDGRIVPIENYLQ